MQGGACPSEFLNAPHSIPRTKETCLSPQAWQYSNKHKMRLNMKHWLLSSLACVIGFLSVSQGLAEDKKSDAAPLKEGYHEIKSKAAAALIKAHKKVVVLDIRTMKEYRIGHIKKAKHIDFFENSFKSNLEKLDRKKSYIVHCASGGRSGRSMQIFKDLGFKSIYHMNDGWKGWEKAGYPAEKGLPKKSDK